MAKHIATLVLFVVMVLSSPLGCLGCVQLVLPLAMPLFAMEITVANGTDETQYITPVQDDVKYPFVISHWLSIWYNRGVPDIVQRDIRLRAQGSIDIIYDDDDTQVTGIVACNVNHDCRISRKTEWQPGGLTYPIDEFSQLPVASPELVRVVKEHPQYEFGVFFWLGVSLITVFAFVGWRHLASNSKPTPKAKKDGQ